MAWGPAAIWAAVLFLLSEVPPDDIPGGWGISDKVAHLGVYFVLGATLAWAAFRVRRPGRGLFFVFLGLLYGATDELHQAFVPGRDPSVGDWLADLGGVVLGFFFLRFLLKAWTERAQGNPNRNLRDENDFSV